MASKIYTKTGDQGKTSLIGGTKVAKSHIRIESYGSIDELNSWIGLVNDLFVHTRSNQQLKEIQDRLFTIGSSLACDPDKEPLMKLPDLKASDILTLELEMDKMNETLPVIRAFILPGGHIAVSNLNITRCICRRAERVCVEMQELGIFIEPLIIIYLNRLSDYLFVLGRFAAHTLHIEEIAWRPRIA